MAESDEEYDRRKRDKFRGERSDYTSSRRDRKDHYDQVDDHRSRDNWTGSDRNSRRDNLYKSMTVMDRPTPDSFQHHNRYASNSHHYHHPPPQSHHRDVKSVNEYSPKAKRFRTAVPSSDWDDIPSLWQEPHQPYYQSSKPKTLYEIDYQTQPPFLSFKAFICQQDDGIEENEAVQKYVRYKTNFNKELISDFFTAHRDEEWFQLKYLPGERSKAIREKENKVRMRLNLFLHFYQCGKIDKISLEQANTDAIVKFLDSVIIKLEGGSDFDLKAVEMESYTENEILSDCPDIRSSTVKKIGNASPNAAKGEAVALAGTESINSSPKKRGAVNTSKEKVDNNNSRTKEEESSSSDSNSESSSSSDSDDSSKSAKESEPLPPGIDNRSNGPESGEDNSSIEDNLDKIETQITTPRFLHRTNSIFLRNLPPNVTKQEVESLCNNVPGYLRVALAEPLPERKFYRRGWITFSRNVDIKNICYKLCGVKIRECEMGPIINRDIMRRTRYINPMAAHRSVVRSDILLSAKIIKHLDSKYNLWIKNKKSSNISESSINNDKNLTCTTDGDAKKNNEEQNSDNANEKESLDEDEGEEENYIKKYSENPLLKNITDYLVDEGNAEEEELLMSNTESVLERDDSLCKVLDRHLLYLRIVHSLDYYNASEYPNEDDMPNKCGIIHCRGANPPEKISIKEVNEWISTFQSRVKAFISNPDRITEEEAKELGMRDVEAEVNKFIESNCVEISKDKWLCPLSNKKFKAPEFVKKHIFNKFAEKVDEVKKEAQYFNNYVNDPKRPRLPEYPKQAPRPINPQMAPPMPYASSFRHAQDFAPPPPRNNMSYYSSHSTNSNRNIYESDAKPSFYSRKPGPPATHGYVNRPREIIQYRDLDAPEETDAY